jgi:hypothetical protein
MRNVQIFKLVGKNAISLQSGTILYESIYKQVLNGEKITLDFTNVELFASPFFNASIGLLLKDISLEQLLASLEIIELNSVGKRLLNHVISNALNFYNEADKISTAIDKTMSEVKKDD